MGLGDDLMITAFVEQEKKKHPHKQIVIGNLDEKLIFDSLIYINNPNITPINKVDRSKPIHFINYHNKNRPYIDYKHSNNRNWKWNENFKPTPGKLYLSDKEKSIAKEVINLAKDYWSKHNKTKYKALIFFESTSTKVESGFYYNKQRNLDWGEQNWKELIFRLKDNYLIIQSKHGTSQKYEGAFYSSIDFDFRVACAIMSECDLFIGQHGGFGHAAAALNKKAVQYFGGWIDPKLIGYDFHENIYFEHPQSPCGTVGYLCSHCDEARKSISVDYFYKKITLNLNN